MNQILIGDCRDLMREMIVQGHKVQMCVTSPPYWGLRDYGTAQWEGGEEGCDHAPRAQLRGTFEGGQPASLRDKPSMTCKCGARRIDKQLGLESTPDEFVESMVEVFRLVRELLVDDGTLWLNLGDSYAGGNGIGRNDAGRNFTGGGGNIEGSGNPGRQGSHKRQTDLKPKDLVGIPWRVAFALQADGWYLRQDIIWHKPNPMPESVNDRCTKAHEYLFLLSKRAKYFYDAEAIREPHAEPWRGNGEHESHNPHSGRLDDFRKEQAAFTVAVRQYNPAGRNRRSVWTIPSQPYADAHFATFPQKLVEPCVLAGSRVGDIVFDPFIGSGTVGQVAENLGRRWIGIDLNSEYAKLARVRTAQMGMAL